MKTLMRMMIAVGTIFSAGAYAQTVSYVNYIRQVQFPSGVQWDATVAASGQQLSELAIDPGGARFELWTVRSPGPTSFLIDSSYVGTYIPVATLTARTEDVQSAVKRTRADRPFFIDVHVSGLRAGADDPEPSKSVTFLRHVQSYGPGGTGIGIDRTQATLHTQSSITTNGSETLTFVINEVPNANRSKVRGEERFSIFSLEDYQAPESQLAAQTVQIWPVADGSISGIAQNQVIRYSLPSLTFTLNDLYPNSTTYVQAYKGGQQLGRVGTVLAGSGLVVNDAVPVSRTLVVNDYGDVFDADGIWTLELLTSTPFGIDRLAFVTFVLDRTIKINSSVTTIQ